MRAALATFLSGLCLWSGPALAKPVAPVQVEASLSRAGARVSLSFRSAGRHVEVHLRGSDGLQLQMPTHSQHDRSFAAGDQTHLSVGFVQIEPRGTLVVSVEGEFLGSMQRIVRSFQVGAPPLDPLPRRQLRAGHAGGGSRLLRLLPAEEQRRQ